MRLDRHHWKVYDDRLVPRFFVAEQTPNFRQRLAESFELGERVSVHFLTAIRFPEPPSEPIAMGWRAVERFGAPEPMRLFELQAKGYAPIRSNGTLHENAYFKEVETVKVGEAL